MGKTLADVVFSKRSDMMAMEKGRYDPDPMLTRHASRAATTSSAFAACQQRRHLASSVTKAHKPPLGCLSADLRHWLEAPGSLTARLRAHGQVTLSVTRQGRFPLWQQERQTLGKSTGHVREVVLMIDGRPAVWARSATPLNAAKGPWRAVKGLGTRPLAELLFTRRQVERDPLWGQRLPRRSAEREHMAREWRRLGLDETGPAPVWCRRSVFWRKGCPLQVMESFAPWVIDLSTPS